MFRNLQVTYIDLYFFLSIFLEVSLASFQTINTCCKFVGQVAGSLPAGTAASPWFIKVLASANPVD